MRLRNSHIILLLLLAVTGCSKEGGLPDLRETYSYKDSKPFGAYAAKEILGLCFSDNYVQVFREPFAVATAPIADTSAVYFCVTKNLYVNSYDVSSLLNFVYNGNTAFISAANFDTILLNKLYCNVSGNMSLFREEPEELSNTSVKLIEGISQSPQKFGYFYFPFSASFSSMNDIYSRIVGYNEDDKPNCIVFFWGKGKLFLHTEPRAFSNYFLLTQNNYRYMQQLVQVTQASPQHVYWDDYYNKHNYPTERKPGTGLEEIFKYPALKAAFWLLLALLLLYILFGMKRRQRIVRKIRANENSSVAFTETVARLYLQKHDNRNIAEKMVNYFNEFIRSNYSLHVNAGDPEFMKTLSRKSGVPEQHVETLYNAINHAMGSSKLNDSQLLSLNNQIEQFYKNRK